MAPPLPPPPERSRANLALIMMAKGGVGLISDTSRVSMEHIDLYQQFWSKVILSKSRCRFCSVIEKKISKKILLRICKTGIENLNNKFS